MPEAQPIEGVKLTQVVIDAASPDVVGSLMKQITEAVLKAIPESAIDKIAREVIERGEVVTQERSSSYSRDTEPKRTVLSNVAKQKFLELVTKAIEKQVAAYFAEDSVRTLVSDLVREGVAAGMAELPNYAAKLTAERLGGTVMGSFEVAALALPARIDMIANSLMKTQQSLIDSGKLPWDAR